MPEKTLIAYATKYGSTKEVAEKIAEALTDENVPTDLFRARDVTDTSQYAAVILGAPLYMFRWHKDARRFLDRNKHSLVDRPAAVFALGPFHNTPEEFKDAREQLDKALAAFEWFSPQAVEVFGGAFDPNSLGFPFKMIPAMKKLPAGDIRDWDAIARWATGLVEELGMKPGDKPEGGTHR